jgi:hypothetical protein
MKKKFILIESKETTFLLVLPNQMTPLKIAVAEPKFFFLRVPLKQL